MAEVVSKKMEFPGVLTGQAVRTRRDVKDMSFLYFAVLVSAAAVLITFAFVGVRLMVVNTGYEISKANSARAALMEQNKRLKLDYLRLKSPERIEKIATAELGLVNPSSGQIVTLR